MCLHTNELDGSVSALVEVIRIKDRQIEELEAEVERLREFEWMYKDLCS